MVILQHNLGSIFSYGNQKSGPVISRSTRTRIRIANSDWPEFWYQLLSHLALPVPTYRPQLYNRYTQLPLRFKFAYGGWPGRQHKLSKMKARNKLTTNFPSNTTRFIAAFSRRCTTCGPDSLLLPQNRLPALAPSLMDIILHATE